MPKVIVCPKGHHFDAERYPKCPHCENSVMPLETVSESKPTQQEPVAKKKRSIFDSPKKHASYAARSVSSLPEDALRPADVGRTVPLFVQNTDKTVPLYAQETQKTVPLYADDIDESGQASSAPTSASHTESAELQAQDATSVSELQKAVSATNSGAVRLDTKTIGFFDIEEGTPEAKQYIEPTVGWIVCVKGSHKGESFPLRSGRNSIGRDVSMDVVLDKEATVSRDKHAHIIYDPLNVIFLLQAGDGHGLTYKNGEIVMTHTDLHSFDHILFGQAEFVFVAFCGDKFKWS